MASPLPEPESTQVPEPTSTPDKPLRSAVKLALGDCLEIMAKLPDACIDAVVTDPPYGLEFMGKEWDSFTERPANESGPQTNTWGTATTAIPGSAYASTLPRFTGKNGASLKPFQDWCELWATECLRVLKPGGYLLAFGGTRTSHRLACAIEDAGFEIRDSIAWLYGSGFPKSLSVNKAATKGVFSRYGSAQCDCLDTRNGSVARNDHGCESRGDSGAARGPGSVSPPQDGTADLPFHAGGNRSPVHELWAADNEETARSAEIPQAVLLSDLRGRGPEAAGLGETSVRARVEETEGGDKAPGRDVSVVREDSAAERQRIACAPSAALPVRGHEPAGESSSSVRFVSPHHRGDDGPGAGVDSSQREPRYVHADGDGRGLSAVARVCSWCGLPDRDWLTSLEPLGTALKPAHEPIVVARKPFTGTVAGNVLAHGTGALHIDACRIGTTDKLGGGAEKETTKEQKGDEGWTRPWMDDLEAREAHAGRVRANVQHAQSLGRWPANVVLDESQAAVLDEQSGDRKAGIYGIWERVENAPYQDSGGASRFFYCAKAPKSERPSVEGASGHPTVKPLSLMRWLVRLVAPPHAIILDPFLGSGTTAEAALLEGFQVIGIERDPAYLELARQRVGKLFDPLPESPAETLSETPAESA